MGRDEKIEFPSVGVCEYGNRLKVYPRAEDSANEFIKKQHVNAKS